MTVKEGGDPILRYADDGYPHFRSSLDMEDGQEANISIKDNRVWKIEAGELIDVGEAVYAGEEGKIFARRKGAKTPAQLMGYAAQSAKAGDVIEIVRNMQMNGNWIKQVTESISEPEPDPEPEEE